MRPKQLLTFTFLFICYTIKKLTGFLPQFSALYLQCPSGKQCGRSYLHPLFHVNVFSVGVQIGRLSVYATPILYFD